LTRVLIAGQLVLVNSTHQPTSLRSSQLTARNPGYTGAVTDLGGSVQKIG